MLIVAKDGTGDFSTIQEAIDAVPLYVRDPEIIFLRKGLYEERVIIDKDNIRLVGEDAEGTVITWSACANDLNSQGEPQGTFCSWSVLVTGVNVEIEHLTIRNDAGDGHLVGQAVALYAAGDRFACRGCRLIAHQDTLFCGPVLFRTAEQVLPRKLPGVVDSTGDCPPVFIRQYFEKCWIQGDTDYIFGPARVWFEDCTLFMNAAGGWYTAANTPKACEYGFVFHRCRLTGECAEGAAALGRPWRKYARTLFLECDMDAHVDPEGFRDWDEERVITWRYGEYGTTGARADLSTRNAREKRLTKAEAESVTLRAVLGCWDGWHPDRPAQTWFFCGDSTMTDQPEWPYYGWGQLMRDFAPVDVYVQNLAMSGRSSKSFMSERRLNVAECCLRAGDRLFIQFSHNDEKPDRERRTEPWTTYPEYLGLYIDAARRRGAEPVLITPLARRFFDGDGRIQHTHDPYPHAMRALAEQRGVRLIELERATERLLEEMGPEKSKEIYLHMDPIEGVLPEGITDNTHLSRNGASIYAQLFMKLLRESEEKD